MQRGEERFSRCACAYATRFEAQTKTKRHRHTNTHTSGVRRQTWSHQVLKQSYGVSSPDSRSPAGVQLRFAIAALHNVRRSILETSVILDNLEISDIPDIPILHTRSSRRVPFPEQQCFQFNEFPSTNACA